MPTYDCHAHIFGEGFPLSPNRPYTPSGEAPLTAYCALLDAHGLDRGFLVQPTFFGTDNSRIADALTSRPGRFVGVAVVPPDIGREDFASLHRAGFRGVRLNFSHSIWQEVLALQRSPALPALLERIRSHGWHVELFCRCDELPLLLPLLLESGARLVLDHFGALGAEDPLNHPAYAGLLRIGDSGRVWIKVSAPYRIGPPGEGAATAARLLPELMKSFGPRRLLWGSDWPHTRHEHLADFASMVRWFEELVPDARTRDVMLREAPAALLDGLV